MIKEIFSSNTNESKEVKGKESQDIKNNKDDIGEKTKDNMSFWDKEFFNLFSGFDINSYDGVSRELSDEEKQDLKEKTGWSDKKIDQKCTYDEKRGVVILKTDCQDKEGSTSECGVPYVRRTININGVKIEGVFAKFKSYCDVKLDEADYKSSSSKQFKICNEKLQAAIEKNPSMKKNFTPEQLKDIENGLTPRGFTWHHNEEPGKMQLVRTEDHDRTIGGAPHTGGNSIWGNQSIEKDATKEGVKF